MLICLGCKDKDGGYDLTGRVYKNMAHGGTASFQMGTYIFTLMLLFCSYYVGKYSKVSRNDISNGQSFNLLACYIFISLYVIFIPLLFLFA